MLMLQDFNIFWGILIVLKKYTNGETLISRRRKTDPILVTTATMLTTTMVFIFVKSKPYKSQESITHNIVFVT